MEKERGKVLRSFAIGQIGGHDTVVPRCDGETFRSGFLFQVYNIGQVVVWTLFLWTFFFFPIWRIVLRADLFFKRTARLFRHCIVVSLLVWIFWRLVSG